MESAINNNCDSNYYGIHIIFVLFINTVDAHTLFKCISWLKKRMKYLKAYKKLSYQHTVVNIKSLLEFGTYDFLQLYSTGYPLSKLRQTAENHL